MDVYHIVLAKLCEVTEGKDSKSINFKDLVKNAGYFGNYPDIFDRLHRESWIIEDSKEDFVRITHWGVAEVKKAAKNGSGGIDRLTIAVNRAKSGITEMEMLLNNLQAEASAENYAKLEIKNAEINRILKEIKEAL